MGTWGELLNELGAIQRKIDRQVSITGPKPEQPSAHDVLRRAYLKKLSERTGRATIVYAVGWHEKGPDAGPLELQVALGDVQGFMEACSNVTETKLDLILGSPGGSPDAAEAIMKYLRTRFEHIRAVIPLAAMSAATMMALACDEILMGSHSQLGPIDPQLTIQTPEGPRSAPGQAIIDQFELAKAECSDPANIAAWLPILRMFGPGLIATCHNARQLSESYVASNLARYMFRDDANAKDKADAAAAWFADFTAFKSHGRRVGRDEARTLGIKVSDLEDDGDLQDAVLSVHHAISHTFAGTGCFKLVENHHGRTWLKSAQQVMVGPIGPLVPGGPGPQIGAPAPTAPGLPPGAPVRGGNRAERRRKGAN